MGDIVMSVRINGITGVDTLKDGLVTESKIATGAVTNTKIGALAVDNGKIADSAINSSKIADGGIAWADLPSGSILQHQYSEFDTPGTQLLSTSSTAFVSTGLSVTITPKFSNSRLLIIGNFNTDTDTTNANGIVSAIYRDGVSISTGGQGGGMFTYSNPTSDDYQMHVIKEYTTSNNTNSTTFTLWVRCWNAYAMRIQGHGGTASLEVWEIKQ